MGSPVVQSQGDYLRALDVPSFLERPDVAAFVGPNLDTFKVKWLKDWERTKGAHKMMKFHWNPMAFVFWFTWFSYRKMWAEFASVTGVFCAAMFLEAWYEQHGGNIPDSAFSGMQIVLGFMATSLYFQRVARFFYFHPNPTQEQVAQAGGVSIPGAIAGTIAYLAAIFGTLYIADMIFPVEVIDTTLALNGGA